MPTSSVSPPNTYHPLAPTDAWYPLVQVRRGDLIESIHFGAVAVVDDQGAPVAQLGDPHLTTFLRSTAKPFQALPFVEQDGIERYGLSSRELAVIVASHTGSYQHLEVVGQVLAKLGLDATALRCGVHTPYDDEAAAALERSGAAAHVLHNNCSGKHAGMLAHALAFGASPVGYLEVHHPVQRAILAALAGVSNVSETAIHVAIDGCSAPCFALPLSAAARAYAQLARPSRQPPARARALEQIAQAMAAHPELVAGPGRLDTCIMQATRGRVVSKGGAEGYQGLALRELGLGVAFKVADGQSRRAVGPIAIELLDQLGALDAQARAELAVFRHVPIRNHRGTEVGRIQPNFALRFERPTNR